MKRKSMIAVVTALLFGLSGLMGCGTDKVAANTRSLPQEPAVSVAEKNTNLVAGGVMLLRVNPEIAVEYDEKGIVTGVTARNDDAEVILSECSDLTGKNAREVVPLLVEAIGKAGYFTEIEGGEYRRITLEIEEDSGSPEEEDFFKEVIREVQDCVNRNNWKAPLNVENKSDYVIIDYDDDLDDKEDDLDDDDADDRDDRDDDLDDDDADDPDDKDDDLDDDDADDPDDRDDDADDLDDKDDDLNDDDDADDPDDRDDDLDEDDDADDLDDKEDDLDDDDVDDPDDRDDDLDDDDDKEDDSDDHEQDND